MEIYVNIQVSENFSLCIIINLLLYVIINLLVGIYSNLSLYCRKFFYI